MIEKVLLKTENKTYSEIFINSPYNTICFDYDGKVYHDDIFATNLISNDFNITLENVKDKNQKKSDNYHKIYWKYFF